MSASTALMLASGVVAAAWALLAFRARDTHVAAGAMFVALGLSLVAMDHRTASYPRWSDLVYILFGVLMLTLSWIERQRTRQREMRGK